RTRRSLRQRSGAEGALPPTTRPGDPHPSPLPEGEGMVLTFLSCRAFCMMLRHFTQRQAYSKKEGDGILQTPRRADPRSPQCPLCSTHTASPSDAGLSVFYAAPDGWSPPLSPPD